MSRTTSRLGSAILTLLFGLGLPSPAAAQSDYLLAIGAPDSVRSEVLNETRQVYIHLPNGGWLPEGERYPVLYLLDGAAHLGGMAAVLDYYGYSHAPPMIVVAVSNREHRTRDLTVSHVDSRQGMAIPESGGADAFMRFLGEELIPYIDASYPTTGYRTLVGHSYGGLFAIGVLARLPELFDTYIAIDPSLDWDEQTLLREAEVAFAEKDLAGKSLFVSLANEIPRFSDTLTIETVESDTTEFSLGIRTTLEFVRMAEREGRSGLRFDWQYYPRDLHGSVPLASMRDGLLFAFDWWELRKPSLYNDPSTPTDQLVALVRTRAERLTKNLGYPMAMEEELLGMMGQMSFDRGQEGKAKAFFDLAVEFYPESAAAHDALAEFHVARGDTALALKSAQQALRLDETDSRLQRVQSLRSPVAH